MKEANSLAEKLLNRKDESPQNLILTEGAPVLSFLPPFLLKENLTAPSQEPKFHFHFFEKLPPGQKAERGHPKAIHQFLMGNHDVFLDFDQLGVVHLSRTALENGNQNVRMRLWLDYALSPELWGTEGKWTRFHERLHKLFEKHNLLDRPDLPGYYPLKSAARSWEKYPFKGDQRNGSFELTLPWTFSLTDLQRLERLLNEEN